MQAWSNAGAGQELQVSEMKITTGTYFRMVGVVLGDDERAATEAHFTPRMGAALEVLQRLRCLDVPMSLGCLLWRTHVLPKALYGCEVRNVTPEQLVKLSSGGKAALGPKFPVRVNE